MPLQLQLLTADYLATASDVLAIFASSTALDKQAVFAAVDKALAGALSEQAKLGDFKGKNEQTLDLITLGKLKARRVLVIGIGDEGDLDEARLRSYAATAARAANACNARTLALVVPDGSATRAVAEGVVLGAYRFSKYLTGDRRPKADLRQVHVHRPNGRATAAEKAALKLGQAVADAVCIARDAVNEPPNELVPAGLAALAQGVAQKHKLKIRVLDKRGIKAAGMKLHYAVAQGSANDPRFIHLSYEPRKAKKKLVFVGKGLTFDSGGLCIKPAPGMGEMKSDMGGAAAVIGLLAAVGAVRPNVEVHGIIGAAENMPDGNAYRPGDVFGSLDGKTVEIINTDAEGRLVLADALAYARKLKPDVLIDAATLTGACVVALGKTCSGFFTGDDKLALELQGAAKTAGESFWRMPLLDELTEQLKSDIADLKHTGDRWGGAISAALFLREFVGQSPWIHCDIAGPALADRARGIVPKGGTGHAVLTFLAFVERAG
jgi:leucyl aminopeptidase